MAPPSSTTNRRRQQKRPKKTTPVPNEPKLIDGDAVTPPKKKVKVAERSESGLRIRIVRENVEKNVVSQDNATGEVLSTPKYVLVDVAVSLLKVLNRQFIF